MNQFEIFRDLHHQKSALIIGNAWDADSAKLLEQNGFKAIATSSGALAQTLGFEDGEKISFDDLLFVVEKIAAAIKVPLSVDLETGYGKNVDAIVKNLERLHALGVVGINIEDSLRSPGKRELESAKVFASTIRGIKEKLKAKNIDIFINARTDAYLLKLDSPLEISLERATLYEEAGADSIFVPFVNDESAIRKITASTRLPINVVSMPGLPSFDKLSEWGVRRISLGSSLFRAVYKKTDILIKNLLRGGNVDGLFA